VAVAEISLEMDYYRLTRLFFTKTNDEAREHFLGALFGIAAADGFVSLVEIEEIRKIAKSLKLTHEQFIQKKNKIPREMRHA
jgi:uncharacterized tellurite resistance protein B-like protein